MEEIKLSMNVRPMTFPTNHMVREIKDSFSGPLCITCECGNHFATFTMDPSDDFKAFRNAFQMQARTVMRKSGIIRPLAGAISTDVVVGVQRPQRHFDSDGVLLDDYRYRIPMLLPAYYRIMESVSKCLYDVAFTDMKQVVKASFARVYRDCHCMEVTLKEVNPSDVDDDIQQLELF